MIRYKEKGKAQVMIGGREYGTVEIGHEDMPRKAMSRFLEVLQQIKIGEQPHFNLVFGEGDIRRGITIVDGIVYAVEKNRSDMKTCRVDYAGLGLSEDSPVEEAVFNICMEALEECSDDIGKWAKELIHDDDIEVEDEKRIDYIWDFYSDAVDAKGELTAAINYFRMPASKKRIREKAFEIEMLRETVRAPYEVAKMCDKA